MLDATDAKHNRELIPDESAFHVRRDVVFVEQLRPASCSSLTFGRGKFPGEDAGDEGNQS